MRIHTHESIALCIDIQERLFPHIHNNTAIEKAATILIQGLSILEVPLLVTEQYVKGLGATIPSLAACLGSYKALEKMCFSCADDSGIMTSIEESGKTTVIMFGIEAHVCVLQTALDLLEKNYRVVLIANAVSSRKEEDKDIAIERMRQHGVIISSYESILFELCRMSGTPRFKQISALVK